MRRWLPIALVLAAGCGGETAGAATTKFTVTASDGEGRSATASLTCGSKKVTATGWARRDARARCRSAIRLARGGAWSPAPGEVCTEIYGGPQRVRVRGTIAGRRVDHTFTRRDGCEIADFDRVLPVFRGSPGDPRG